MLENYTYHIKSQVLNWVSKSHKEDKNKMVRRPWSNVLATQIRSYLSILRLIRIARIGCLPLIGLLVTSLLPDSALFAQNYFKKLEESDKFFKQQVTHFPNGDLLIGDSSLEAVRTGKGGEIYMTRLDPCGNIEWSRIYRRQEEYLEFKDFKINEANDIFIYGSAYIGLDELIFLLKLDERGNILQFKFYEPETVDHFSYNIDLRNGRLMLYGLILDFGTKKFGFVAVFDEGLNFLWGKKFSPFSSSGGALITEDNGFVCRSGQYLFKLDAKGELEWATELAPNINNSPVSGPIEVSDGYILEALGDGMAFFYKVSPSGTLIWKSDQFPSKPFPADMILQADGQISAVYSARRDNQQQLCRLLLAPDGQIVYQEQLSTAVSIKPGRVYHSFLDRGPVAISVNPDPAVPQAVDAAGFLLQSLPGELSKEDCFTWNDFQAVQPNQVPMDFIKLDTTILSTTMTFTNNTNITPASFEIPLTNACTDAPELELIQTDTLLNCDQEWVVNLPTADFRWQDGETGTQRTLSTPGTYSASNEDCGAEIVYKFTLDKPDCECQTFLPTAFSPNQDGQNDYLELFTGCELSQMHLTIFNRWGEKVFESNTPGIFWDGSHRTKPAPNGLYLVKVEYEWVDHNGQLQLGSILQNVTLVK